MLFFSFLIILFIVFHMMDIFWKKDKRRGNFASVTVAGNGVLETRRRADGELRERFARAASAGRLYRIAPFRAIRAGCRINEKRGTRRRVVSPKLFFHSQDKKQKRRTAKKIRGSGASVFRLCVFSRIASGGFASRAHSPRRRTSPAPAFRRSDDVSAADGRTRAAVVIPRYS